MISISLYRNSHKRNKHLTANLDVKSVTEQLLSACIDNLLEAIIRLRASKFNTATFQPATANELACALLISPYWRAQPLVCWRACQTNADGDLIQILVRLIGESSTSILLGLTKVELKSLIAVTKISSQHTELAVRFCEIWSMLMSQFNNHPVAVSNWLSNSKRPLLYNPPILLMRSEYGRQSVIDIIERLKTGDVS